MRRRRRNIELLVGLDFTEKFGTVPEPRWSAMGSIASIERPCRYGRSIAESGSRRASSERTRRANRRHSTAYSITSSTRTRTSGGPSGPAFRSHWPFFEIPLKTWRLVRVLAPCSMDNSHGTPRGRPRRARKGAPDALDRCALSFGSTPSRSRSAGTKFIAAKRAACTNG